MGEASQALEQAKKVSEAANEVKDDAYKAAAEREYDTEDAKTAAVEKAAADKNAAEATAADKRADATAKWKAIHDFEMTYGKAKAEMLQAAKTAGYRQSSEKQALDKAKEAENAAVQAAAERKAADDELAKKKAAL